MFRICSVVYIFPNFCPGINTHSYIHVFYSKKFCVCEFTSSFGKDWHPYHIKPFLVMGELRKWLRLNPALCCSGLLTLLIPNHFKPLNCTNASLFWGEALSIFICCGPWAWLSQTEPAGKQPELLLVPQGLPWHEDVCPGPSYSGVFMRSRISFIF